MFNPVDLKIDFSKLEKEILVYWEKNQILKKYLNKNNSSKKRFSFIDGPITANNPMGVHHAWGRTFKDLWQRFYQMLGYKQRFQNGFDCQGLWVEVEVEKELGLKSKKDIENLVFNNRQASIAKFVELCKERVKKYSDIQTQQSIRLGYFMNWEHSYYTMSAENNYMIWHFLKKCQDKGWLYKGKDSVPWCPRCETAISQHEMLTEDYKELVHESIFLKLPIVTKGWDNTFLLAWTTTPWTIPGNVAIGVNPNFSYDLWFNENTNEKIIILGTDENGQLIKRTVKNKELNLADYVFLSPNGVNDYRKIGSFSGDKLLNLKYLAPFDNLLRVKDAEKQNPSSFHQVIDAKEIVVSNEGTGLLHVAPGAGQEDYKLKVKYNLPLISIINDRAEYLEGLGEFSNQNAKKHPEIIINYLQSLEKGKFLLKVMPYLHRYPACWRCKTELVWKVADEWYISMDKKEKTKSRSKNSKNLTFRQQMIEVAKKINWLPAFGLERELDWLGNMHDWLISKPNRYWGLALPIWECHKCGSYEIIGSEEELKKKAVLGFEKMQGRSPHKPYIDEIKLKCQKCGEIISRINDVGNVWLDAGIVAFSTFIDPQTKKISYLADKKYWKEWFPADFITESFPGQFKNWFYALIAEATGLEKNPPFKTVLGFGTLLGEDGRPMHKSWGNSIEFNEGADKIGADVMRWMYLTHNPADNLYFGYKKADETRRKFHLLLWNIYNFFLTYANIDQWGINKTEKNYTMLDKWILNRLYETVQIVTKELKNYSAQKAALFIENFNNDLSLWYIRRSRSRAGLTNQDNKDKYTFYSVLHEVLLTLSHILAPFTPFLAETIYLNLNNEKQESVHLSTWPIKFLQKRIDKKLLKDMQFIREIVSIAHSERKRIQIKLRQPLFSIEISTNYIPDKKLDYLLLDELNVKKIVWKKTTITEIKVTFDTLLSPELIAEGKARDIVRLVQEERKKISCGLGEKIILTLSSWPNEWTEYIKKETLSSQIIKGDNLDIKLN